MTRSGAGARAPERTRFAARANKAAWRVLFPVAYGIYAVSTGRRLPSRAPNSQEDDYRLKHNDPKNFADRRQEAAEAKKKLLEKFAKAPKADDPEVAAKRAERAAIAAAREERRAERERLKREEQEKKAAEEAARAEAAAAKAAEEERERNASKHAMIEQIAADQAAKKAERDRRYAARKARKR